MRRAGADAVGAADRRGLDGGVVRSGAVGGEWLMGGPLVVRVRDAARFAVRCCLDSLE
ncbi:hypothetical protein THIOKS13070012 [Thiocapsa sp. KS1]|nr:hypothetical protein THIOKS13070012 [Thiocapsa sp. KS1]